MYMRIYTMAELDKLAPGIKFPEIFRRLGAHTVGVSPQGAG